ncbi:MAG: DUF4368 domain-containing protein [Desulfitobacteriaceae bacterium]|nr:DUF4368 domain-containing protein [Desulfitobacteriaceae bacterium]MDI6914372.1 DUF4368 domain-containing protein [Desulfitobacteriaceae bacterium]
MEHSELVQLKLNEFTDKVKRYTEINELTSELLNLFIERIEVGE